MKITHQDRLVAITTLPNLALSAAVSVANGHPEQAIVVAAVAVVGLYLRIRWQVPMSHSRTQRVLEAAAKNPGLSFNEVTAVKGLPAAEQELVEAEVRARLRDIAEALDPASVEPLYRLLQERRRGRLSRDEASQAATYLRALSAAELLDLERMMKEALNLTNDLALRLVLRLTPPPEQAPLRVSVLVDREMRELTFVPAAKRLFRLLRDTGLAEQLVRDVTPRATLGDGSGPVYQETIIVRRSYAQMLLQVVASAP